MDVFEEFMQLISQFRNLTTLVVPIPFPSVRNLSILAKAVFEHPNLEKLKTPFLGLFWLNWNFVPLHTKTDEELFLYSSTIFERALLKFIENKNGPDPTIIFLPLARSLFSCKKLKYYSPSDHPDNLQEAIRDSQIPPVFLSQALNHACEEAIDDAVKRQSRIGEQCELKDRSDVKLELL